MDRLSTRSTARTSSIEQLRLLASAHMTSFTLSNSLVLLLLPERPTIPTTFSPGVESRSIQITDLLDRHSAERTFTNNRGGLGVYIV